MVLANPLASPAQGRSGLVIEQAKQELRAGNRIEARRLLLEHLARKPKDAAVLDMVADMAVEDEKIEEVTLYRRRAVLAERTEERELALLRHLKRFVGPQSVLDEIAECSPKTRELYEVRGMAGSAHGELGNDQGQLEEFEGLLEKHSDSADLWRGLGLAYKTVGRFDEAVDAVHRAIKLNPAYGEAYFVLANMKAYRFSDEEIAAMKRQLRRNLPAVDKLHLHFALGKAFEDRKQYALSFEHYAAGNAMRRKDFLPRQRSYTAYVDQVVASMDKDFFETRSGQGTPEPDPIFILGLHRAGSTLLEQILASHSLIEDTNELNFVHAMYNRLPRMTPGMTNHLNVFAKLGGADLAAMGREYLDRCQAFRRTGKPFFIDKMPQNWLFVWMIRLVLPNAKIIDARRHPLACGFSNFRQYYNTDVTYAYDLEDIGTFYRDYWRMMRHIDKVQPGKVHRVINEHLIDDPEGEIRKMLDYLELPFEQACLEHHKNKRAVRTPSSEQVRQPINRSGVDQWKNYEQWLDPLKKALGPALEQWDQC